MTSSSSSSSSDGQFSPLLLLVETLDRCVETYLRVVIRPFVRGHERVYGEINRVLRAALDARPVPLWFTANFITYARTVLVVPCLQLLAWGHAALPSLIVLLVDFGDFLDGVVARYWVDRRRAGTAPTPTPADGDAVPSMARTRRDASYGGFVDAVCDKCFVVPCWIYLLSAVTGGGLWAHAQHLILWFLIVMEISSACIRFRAFFTSEIVASPKMVGMDFSNSAVKADHVGKAKQTFEMVGTSLFMLPYVHVLGVFSLFLAVPLSYESVRRKVVERTVYVFSDDAVAFDHSVLTFWSRARGLGSRLVVGVPGGADSTAFRNAAAHKDVDAVVPDAPRRTDLPYLRRHGADFFVTTDASTATEAVVSANMCLVVGPDGAEARVASVKAEVEKM